MMISNKTLDRLEIVLQILHFVKWDVLLIYYYILYYSNSHAVFWSLAQIPVLT